MRKQLSSIKSDNKEICKNGKQCHLKISCFIKITLFMLAGYVTVILKLVDYLKFFSSFYF